MEPFGPHSSMDGRSDVSVIRHEEDEHIRRFGIAVSVCDALAIAFATLTPSSQQDSPHSLCLICGDLGGVDVLLNVLLYMPIGAGLAMAGVRRRNSLLALGVSSLLIEVLQWMVIPGRDGSVGDVVTNSLGAFIGFVVGAHLEALLRPRPREARVLVASWMALWIALQATAAYAMQPSPTRRPYYGQLARALGNEQGYPGRILAATLDRKEIPDRDIPYSRAVYEALSRPDGAELDVAMQSPTGPTNRPSIARIADDREEEIIALAAEGRDLVFEEAAHGRHSSRQRTQLAGFAPRHEDPYVGLIGFQGRWGVGTFEALEFSAPIWSN